MSASKLFSILIRAKGDLLAGTDADQVDRLPVGENGQVLTANSAAATGLAWETPSGAGGGIPETIVDAKGDLIVATAADTVVRLPVGADGQILMANSDATEGVAWTVNYADKLYVYVKNETGTTLTKGQAVYISGANGTNALVSLADADLENTSSKTLGLLVQTLAQGDHGYVITNGRLDGIDTSGATAAGDTVWLSSTAGGRVYVNPPAKPAHAVYLGVVTRKHAVTGEIEVKVQNGYELQELHNVENGTPTTGDVLRYNSTNSLWEHSPALTDLTTTVAGKVASVGATAPITSTGGTTPTIAINDASTSAKGAVQLEDSTTSTSTTKAATPNSVKSAYDLAAAAIPKSVVDAKGDLLVASAADTIIRLAAGVNGQVLAVDSSTASGLAWKLGASNIQEFTSSGTWTKPAGATWAMILAIGGGGGGKSGVGPGAASPAGGGGGAGAVGVVRMLPLAALGATETVTIGAGGQGGASVTTGTNANNGLDGNNTTFGSLITAPGGTGSQGSSSFQSTIGRAMVATARTATADPRADGGGTLQNTNLGVPGTSATRAYFGPGGGGGGGSSSATVVAQGGAGAGGFGGTIGGAGGVLAGDQGADATRMGDGGGAGAGSAGNTSPGVAGGRGGHGLYGGGGGGGGGGRTISSVAYASGAGGNGGDGYCLVVSF